MKGDITVFQCSKGSGMELFTFQWLLQRIMADPGKVIYVNFQLPKAQRKVIEKYATIKRVIPHNG